MQSARLYPKARGRYVKGIGFVGTAATAVDEALFIANAPEGKRAMAAGATVTNVAGEVSSIALGMKCGAAVGTWFAPFTFGLSIPVSAAAGGFLGYYFYNASVKPMVREGWTGEKPNGE